MLFNSCPFIFIFLPAAFGVYFVLNRYRLTIAAKSWLVLCSLFFYAYWNPAYLGLILASILFNFSLGSAIRPEAGRSRLWCKTALVAGVLANLLLLGYYKYTDFFISNWNTLAGAQWPLAHWVLPLGISFFTFTQIAYLVDSHRAQAREADFLNYLLFVSYFPHLIAGPIVHHAQLMPQFDDAKNKVIRWKNIASGLFLFSIGLFKKVMIADSLSGLAADGFDVATSLDFARAWVTALSYTFQLYFDFSGYIDMAVGASLLFNIRLPQNFDSPYKACDIQEFWRRWHITLSHFLRDYVYIPLGGSRSGEWTACRNLLIAFVLGGFWHGASWTFVFWGFLHGAAMIVRRLWSGIGGRFHPALARALTFCFVVTSWVFFRAKTWEDALKVLRGMFSPGAVLAGDWFDLKKQILLVAGIAALAFFTPNSDALARRFRPTAARAVFAVTLVFISLLGMTRVREFLYFNF